MAVLPTTSGALLDKYSYLVSERRTMPSDQHSRALLVLYHLLLGLLTEQDFVTSEVAVLLDQRHHRRHLTPDLFVAHGVGQLDPIFGTRRLQYRPWDEGKAPDLVVELSSPSTVTEDIEDEKQTYTTLGVREYVLFDPLGTLLEPRLEVFHLQEGTNQRAESTSVGDYPVVIASVALGHAWVQVGDFLRLIDPVAGTLIPTPEEAAVSENERLKAEIARLRATSQAPGGANQESGP